MTGLEHQHAYDLNNSINELHQQRNQTDETELFRGVIGSEQSQDCPLRRQGLWEPRWERSLEKGPVAEEGSCHCHRGYRRQRNLHWGTKLVVWVRE